MKQTLNLTLVILLIFFAYSCEKEGMKEHNQYINTEIVDFNTAKQIAEKFTFEMSNSNKKSTITKKTIKEEIVLNDDGLPSLYIFNYQDSGFIIMSAEQNEVPILAYCNEGIFDEENMPLGVALWIETTKENIKIIRKGIMGNFRLGQYEWKKLMEESGINTYNSKLKVIDYRNE